MPSGLEKVSPLTLPVRLGATPSAASRPASSSRSHSKVVASGESPRSCQRMMWPCELLARGLEALVRLRLPLLVSVQNTVLSTPTVIHSGRSISVAPATRAAAWVFTSTSACELKSTIVPVMTVPVATCVKLPGSVAPVVRLFLPTVSSTQLPLPSSLKRAAYSVPSSSRPMLLARLAGS
ncbi:hypothetical protein D9M68_767840 [compost metagenome]